MFITRMVRTRHSKTWLRRRRMLMMMMKKRNALWMLTRWRRVGLWMKGLWLRGEGMDLSPGQLRHGSITRTWKVSSQPSSCMAATSPLSSHILLFFLLASRGQEYPELWPAAQKPIVLRRWPLNTVGAAAGVTSTPLSNHYIVIQNQSSNSNNMIHSSPPTSTHQWHFLLKPSCRWVHSCWIMCAAPVRAARLKCAVLSSGWHHWVLWGPAAGLHPHPLPGPVRLPEPQRAQRQKYDLVLTFCQSHKMMKH